MSKPKRSHLTLASQRSLGSLETLYPLVELSANHKTDILINFRVSHIYRECNAVADQHANYGAMHNDFFFFCGFLYVPLFLAASYGRDLASATRSFISMCLVLWFSSWFLFFSLLCLFGVFFVPDKKKRKKGPVLREAF